jgi:hypothetical protein
MLRSKRKQNFAFLIKVDYLFRCNRLSPKKDYEFEVFRAFSAVSRRFFEMFSVVERARMSCGAFCAFKECLKRLRNAKFNFFFE